MPGGAGGTIQAMIQSLRFNKSQLTKRKSYKEIRKLYNRNYKYNELIFKKADPVYLKTIRNEIIKDQRREFIKRIIVIGLSIMLVFGIISIILFSMNVRSFTASYFDSVHYKETLKKEKNKAFIMFVNYGDNYFSHHDYTLAINSYESALRLNQDNIHVKYKLSTILYYSCLDSNRYCSKAVNVLTEIISKSDTAIYALEEEARFICI